MNNMIKHPYLSLDKQIEHLEKDKGLIFQDKQFAKKALQTFSYYSVINGYKDLFLSEDSNFDKEIFIPGTTFEMLYQIHWMDLTLNNIIFKYSLIVEKKLKSILSNRIAQSFSIYEERYLDSKCYSKNKNFRWIYNRLIKEIDDISEDDISVQHYKKNEGNVPPWIYAKALTFGSIIDWYTILQPEHKDFVITDFLGTIFLTDNEKRDFFKRSLKQIHQFRNSSAHGNRLFMFKLKPKHKHIIRHLEKLKFKEYFLDENSLVVGNDNLFSVLFSILLLINDSYVLSNFLTELYRYLLEYSQIEYNFVGKNVDDLLGLDENFFFKLARFYDEKFNVDLSKNFNTEAIKISY